MSTGKKPISSEKKKNIKRNKTALNLKIIINYNGNSISNGPRSGNEFVREK